MSFAVSGTLSMRQDLGPQVDAIFDAAPAAKEHAGVLASVARDAVLAAAANLAGPDDRLTVSIYGHYNGGTDPVPGWASNMLNVSLSQAYGPGEEA